MKPIIKIDNLSKQYRFTPSETPLVHYDNLRESLVKSVRAPFKRLQSKNNHKEENFWALRDVSFDVMPSEVVGIIGPNGAGKSTLLKVLSRIIEPTAGRVELYGRVASLLGVGTGFHPDLTGKENVYLNGAVLGMKRREIDARFDEIVAFAEVEKFLDMAVKHYSSGMYVRLAFAVAAHLDPEILIIDEVLAVGDTSFRKKCIGKISDATKLGRTVLFVSHSMPMVNQLCQRAILLTEGRINRMGPAEEVVKYYNAVCDEKPAQR